MVTGQFAPAEKLLAASDAMPSQFAPAKNNSEKLLAASDRGDAGPIEKRTVPPIPSHQHMMCANSRLHTSHTLQGLQPGAFII
jgi:hypothetical protein